MSTKRTWIQKFSAVPYYVWAVLFIIAPLLFVLYYAFTDYDGNFTVDNFGRMFNSNTINVFITSLAFAFIATVICLLVAYPLAYAITKAKLKNQSILITLFMLPMWMNFILRTYALSFILEDTGLINTILKAIGIGQVKLIYTPGAVILGMFYNFLPYMLLPIYSVMSKMDKRLIEASEDLGCNKLQTLIKVILPLSLPGVISGITMVFVPSVSTFYISQQLGPTSFTLIGDVIESNFKSTGGVYNYGSAISFVLMLLIFVSLAVMNKFTDEDAEGSLIV